MSWRTNRPLSSEFIDHDICIYNLPYIQVTTVCKIYGTLMRYPIFILEYIRVQKESRL
jgi:hypothetical protein